MVVMSYTEHGSAGNVELSSLVEEIGRTSVTESTPQTIMHSDSWIDQLASHSHHISRPDAMDSLTDCTKIASHYASFRPRAHGIGYYQRAPHAQDSSTGAFKELEGRAVLLTGTRIMTANFRRTFCLLVSILLGLCVSFLFFVHLRGALHDATTQSGMPMQLAGSDGSHQASGTEAKPSVRSSFSADTLPLPLPPSLPLVLWTEHAHRNCLLDGHGTVGVYRSQGIAVADVETVDTCKNACIKARNPSCEGILWEVPKIIELREGMHS